MNHRRDIVAGEQIAQAGAVANIAFNEGRFFTRQLLNAMNRLARGIAQVIQYYNVVAALQ